jgi:hypothetical protein
MAGFFTDYSNNCVLNLVLGAVTYTPPPTLYIGLSQNAAVKNGFVIEPSGGGYIRVAVLNNTSNFPVASEGTKTNAIPIGFPAASATWGTIQSVFVADALSGGNVLMMADLVTPKTIVTGGSPATIAPGALFLSHT